MTERQRRAEYLFSEMNGIDEVLLQQAILPYASARAVRMARMRRVVLLAAALTLVAAILIGTVAVAYLRDKEEESGREQSGVESTVWEDAAQQNPDRLGDVLLRAESNTSVERLSAEEIDLFDGTVKIIWQAADEVDYHVCTLQSVTAQKRLIRTLQKRGETVENGAKESQKVWISMGDGKVVSPYLAISEGNVGYGVLFDYEIEVMPDGALIETVEDLISDS